MICKKPFQLLALFASLWAIIRGYVQDDPQHFTATIGEDVILPCAFEFPENKPVQYVIQWQKQGIKIPIYIWYDGYPSYEGDGYVGRMSLAHQASLNLTNVHESDQGWYECNVHFLNRPPDSPENGTWVHLDVHGPASIVVPPRNVTKLEGDKAKFICDAKALPTNVTHRWFHNGVEISQLSWLETRTVVRGDGTLFISPISAEDSGKFTCEVTNGIGTPDTASAYLSVEYPARITYSPTIQYLPLGLSGVVRCYVQASPPFTFITWTKDRRPFDPNATPGVVFLNNGSLLFQRVSHAHQGIYRCTPYNLHGTAGTSNAMEVLVRGKSLTTVSSLSPTVSSAAISVPQKLMPSMGSTPSTTTQILMPTIETTTTPSNQLLMPSIGITTASGQQLLMLTMGITSMSNTSQIHMPTVAPTDIKLPNEGLPTNKRELEEDDD